MPVRIRLQRHGKKGKPFYWVVAADARAKRDGKFLEKLGTYNPNTNPATIDINIDNSVKWLQNGAQPSETARRILSYKGVLLKHHLLAGVQKGALTEEQLEARFGEWQEAKSKTINKKSEGLDKARAEAKAKSLEAEKLVAEKRAQVAVEEEAPEVVEETTGVAGEVVEEAQAGEAIAEAAEAAENAEAQVAEAEEAAKEVTEVAEAVKEEPAKAAEEAPKAESEVAEEAPEKAKEEE